MNTERYEELGGSEPGKPLPLKPLRNPGYKPEGCKHTTDPNGWLMDGDGNLTDRCPCWRGES